jgi:DMSO/TMAO reductase YedYZ molybdopterin-dependent catalytic subunit
MGTVRRRITRRELLRLGLGGVAAAWLAACGRGAPEETAVATPLEGDPATPSFTPKPTPTASAVPPTATAGSTTTPTGAPQPTYPPFEYPSDVTITPIEDFYTVTYHPQRPPQLPDFRLRIWGLVENELNLSLDELQAMPVVEQMRTLECISNPVGGNLISNGVWRGVSMAHLLELADVQSRAKELKLECADGYSTSIPVALAMHPDSFLAYWMNGVPLPAKHGSPLRALWPGRYGQKQPKWLTSIQLIAEPYLGHWERQGWSNEALIRPNSRIDLPAKLDVVELPAVVSGIAYANGSGVARVEVSTDDGVTWHDAELTHGPSSLVWTEWRHQWREGEPGSHVIRARVTDGDGQRQRIGKAQLLGGVKPDGTDFQHTVAVTVKG